MNCTARLILAAVSLVGPIAGRSALGGSLMQMTIEAVETHDECVAITTTGSEFVLDRTHNAIVCYQRIPSRRRITTIRSLTLKGMKRLSRSDDRCVFGASKDNPAVEIGADGLLRLSLAAGADVEITGSYEPAWQGRDRKSLPVAGRDGRNRHVSPRRWSVQGPRVLEKRLDAGLPCGLPVAIADFDLSAAPV